ncbi:MAG: hypothetical protein NT172_10985 [Planctomycetota bacterium]|nr:hypothetical protein [Planctomycetota bacterium]
MEYWTLGLMNPFEQSNRELAWSSPIGKKRAQVRRFEVNFLINSRVSPIYAESQWR